MQSMTTLHGLACLEKGKFLTHTSSMKKFTVSRAHQVIGTIARQTVHKRRVSHSSGKLRPLGDACLKGLLLGGGETTGNIQDLLHNIIHGLLAVVCKVLLDQLELSLSGPLQLSSRIDFLLGTDRLLEALLLACLESFQLLISSSLGFTKLGEPVLLGSGNDLLRLLLGLQEGVDQLL